MTFHTTTIAVPENLIKIIDIYAVKKGMNRSQYVREILDENLPEIIKLKELMESNEFLEEIQS